MKNHFYHHTIWKHVAAFADLFDDMTVYVYDDDRKIPVGMKKVPLILAPKEKVVSALSVLAGEDRPEIDNVLPKISVIWQGITWDNNRQTGSNLTKRVLAYEYDSDDEEEQNRQNRLVYVDLQPIPWKLEFQVTFWTKYMDEAVQLLENTLPFFHPDLHLSIFERISGQERKSKVTLDSVTPNFVYELNEPDRRVIQFDLNFTMECMLYRPYHTEKDIHKAYIGVTAVANENDQENDGDVIYMTTTGVSGSITDEQIRSVIISYDAIENQNTIESVELQIENLEIQKQAALDALPAGADPDVIRTTANSYDSQIAYLGWPSPAMPFNALQYNRAVVDTLMEERSGYIVFNGSVIPSDFPLYYEDGYDDLYDQLNETEQHFADDVKRKYDEEIKIREDAKESEEYIQTLFNQGVLPPGIKERSAEYNYYFKTLD